MITRKFKAQKLNGNFLTTLTLSRDLRKVMLSEDHLICGTRHRILRCSLQNYFDFGI